MIFRAPLQPLPSCDYVIVLYLLRASDDVAGWLAELGLEVVAAL